VTGANSRIRGGNDSVTPFGAPLADTVTDPVNPLLRCKFTWVVVLSPGPIRRFDGELEIKNRGTRLALPDDFDGDLLAALLLDFVVFLAGVPLDFFPDDLDPDLVPLSLAGGVAPAAFVVAGPDGSVGPTAETVETPIPVSATLVKAATRVPVRNRRARLLARSLARFRTEGVDGTDGMGGVGGVGTGWWGEVMWGSPFVGAGEGKDHTAAERSDVSSLTADVPEYEDGRGF
jgi:hypothetical protein